MDVRGKVIRGEGLAKIAFGIPTANLQIDQPISLEAGVYTAVCWVGIVKFNAVVYVGPVANEKFEVHLFGYDGNLYGKTLEVTLLEKVGEHVPWVSEEQMRTKILQDIARARAYFSTPRATLAKSLDGL